MKSKIETDLKGIEVKIIDMLVYSDGECEIMTMDDEVYLYHGVKALQLSGDEIGVIKYIDKGVPNGVPSVYEDYIYDMTLRYVQLVLRVGKVPSFANGLDVDEKLIQHMLKLRDYDNEKLDSLGLGRLVKDCDITSIKEPMFLVGEIKDEKLELTLRNDLSMLPFRLGDKAGLLIYSGEVNREDVLVTNINIATLEGDLFRVLYANEYIRDLLYYYEPPVKTTSAEVIEALNNNAILRILSSDKVNRLYYYVDFNGDIFLYYLLDGVYEAVLAYTLDDRLPKYLSLPEVVNLNRLHITGETFIELKLLEEFKNLIKG